MPIEIRMPALSPTMEKGNLARWLKKEGERVKPGDVIAEIETDKAIMEYEAIDEGTLAKIVVPAGTADVPVNQLIALLAGEGEDLKVAAAGAGTPASQPVAAVPSANATYAQTTSPQPSPQRGEAGLGGGARRAGGGPAPPIASFPRRWHGDWRALRILMLRALPVRVPMGA
jgi:pyruvate dehydrogenase E2 component (dihydrolipoamide acetyltransferase)